MAIGASAEIARAYLSVQVDDRKLQPGLQGVKKAVVSNAQEIASMAGQMLAGLGLAAAGGSMLQAAANYESTATSMEVMLGSADKAKKMLEELNQFSLTTPFTPKEVNDAAKTLLSFGFAGDEVADTLQYLGDVGAVNNNLGQLALVMGQVRSQGKLMGQDLLQLINAGFNPLQELSRTSGKSMAQLKDEMSKGQISFEMVRDAFQSATGPGGQFFQMMIKQSKTFSGLVSTMNGMIQEVAKSIGMKMLPIAKSAVSSVVYLAQGVLNLDGTLGGAISTITVTSGALLGLTQMLLGANTALKMFGMTWASVGKMMLVGSGIGLVAVALGGAVVGIQKLVGWLMGMESVQNAVASATDKMSQAWVHLKAAAIPIGHALWALLQTVSQTIFGTVLPSFDTLRAGVVSTFIAGVEWVSKFVLEASKWIRVLVENWDVVWDVVKTSAQISMLQTADYFRSGLTRMYNAGIAFRDSMAEVFAAIGDALTGNIAPWEAAEQIYRAGSNFRKSVVAAFGMKLPENPMIAKLEDRLERDIDELGRAKAELDAMDRDREIDKIEEEKPKEEEDNKGQDDIESKLENGFFGFSEIQKKLQDQLLKAEDDQAKKQTEELKKGNKTWESQLTELQGLRQDVQRAALPLGG